MDKARTPVRSPAVESRKLVVMVGTSMATMGGVAAVTRQLVDSSLAERFSISYIASHCDGTLWQKLVIAVRAVLHFLRLLALRRVSLLHVHTSSYISFWRKCLFILPALTSRIPVIVHLHGGDFMSFFQGQGATGQRFIRFVLERAAGVIVLTDVWKTRIRLLAPAARLHVIPNPVRLPPSHPSRLRRPNTLLYLGLIAERKGVFDLIEAVWTLKKRYPALRLLCGGHGDQDALLARARELGIDRDVQMLGWIGPASKARLLARCGVFVLPSHLEALPMALLEAMAAGAPVVATTVGGIPDAVTDGEEALLVPPGRPADLAAALDRLLSNATIRDELGAAARDRVARQFSLDLVVWRIDALYRQVCAPANAQR